MKNKHQFLLPALVLVVGLSAFIARVWADTASTAVTVSNTAPSLSAVSFNGSQNITLTENSYVWASSTLTVSDSNGCSTISSVTVSFKLASSTDNGSFCSYDGNTCYEKPDTNCVATTTGNTCDGGTDTSAGYDCGFQIWYLAEPTNASAPIWASSIWVASATATDSGSLTGTATNTAESIEVNTAAYLSLSGNISYAETAPGSDTGSTDQTVTITNTGNLAQDTEISGDSMCSDYPTCVSGKYMDPTQQKFDLTASVAYASKTYTLAATSSPATIETVLVKPTATGTPVTDDTYWGIGIPSGQATESYEGQNTFSAVAD